MFVFVGAAQDTLLNSTAALSPCLPLIAAVKRPRGRKIPSGYGVLDSGEMLYMLADINFRIGLAPKVRSAPALHK